MTSFKVSHIINYLIDFGIYSLQAINGLKAQFSFGDIEIGNISRDISRDRNGSCVFKMTAREMMCFVHFFPLIYGNRVPEDNEVWLFF